MSSYTIIINFLIEFFKDEQSMDTFIIIICKFIKRIAFIFGKKIWAAEKWI
jgi:hypothetical protein